jgi:hypothetical protein
VPLQSSTTMHMVLVTHTVPMLPTKVKQQGEIMAIMRKVFL